MTTNDTTAKDTSSGKATDKKEETFEQAYGKLAREHNLPSLEKIKPFNVESLEKATLPELARKVADRYDTYAGIVEGILQPDQTITAIHESEAFSPSEKEELLMVLKQLMHTYRTYTYITIRKEEEALAKFINQAVFDWDSIITQLEAMTAKLREAWLHQESVQIDIGYLG